MQVKALLASSNFQSHLSSAPQVKRSLQQPWPVNKRLGALPRTSHPLPARPERHPVVAPRASLGLPELAAFSAGATAFLAGGFVGALPRLRENPMWMSPKQLRDLGASALLGSLLGQVAVIAAAHGVQNSLPGHPLLTLSAAVGVVAGVIAVSEAMWRGV